MRALSSRNTLSKIVLRNQIDKIRLLFRKDRESYLCFYRILGFYPRNIQLYEQALLHKSTSVRSDKGRPLNNERLEFLGDAILDAIVGDIVYKRFEGKREGFLTNTRSKIVQRACDACGMIYTFSFRTKITFCLLHHVIDLSLWWRITDSNR